MPETMWSNMWQIMFNYKLMQPLRDCVGMRDTPIPCGK